MTRISSRTPVTTRPPADRTPALKAETKKQIKTSAEKLLKAGTLQFSRAPAGDNFVRVPISKGKGPDQYSYSALIPTGGKT
ncbi:MAG TPA: hypothetical protein VGE37_04320, partial [Archangium sp.]